MANFHEVMDINQRSAGPKGKAPKAEISSIEHAPSANGGHVFTHRFSSGPSNSYHEPETHTFGKEEGHAALAHFAKHSGLSEHMSTGEAEDHVEDDEDSAAGAAS